PRRPHRGDPSGAAGEAAPRRGAPSGGTMSNPDRRGQRAPRHPLLAIVMAIIGVILLLPGACAVFFASNMLRDLAGPDLAWVGPLWAICLLISLGGLWLIRKAFR